VQQHLLEWLTLYGAPVLFLAQLLGIFGLPIPDELLLTVAGALIRRGTLHGSSIVVAAIGGCAAGITISYVIGRTLGICTLKAVVHVHDGTLARVQGWFRRYGCWLLAFGYFIPGVRHVTAIAAGSAPLEYGTFAAFAYPGAVLWSSVFVAVGYFAGDRWPQVFAFVRGHIVMFGAVALVAALAGAVVRTRQRTRV
jgi:membrane protein DedA with SNARE-associated domain